MEVQEKVFCPNGPGGGVDPTCPANSSGGNKEHPLRSRMRDDLNKSKILTKEQKKRYGEALDTVLSKMPESALKRAESHLGDGAKFYPSATSLVLGMTSIVLNKEGVTEAQIERVRSLRTRVMNGTAIVGGAYLKTNRGSVHLDGDFPGKTGGAHGKESQGEAEVYAHEFTHAIDGPSGSISRSEAWQKAFDQEIGPEAKAEDGGPRLSRYAQSSLEEGLAEFGRLVYGGKVPLDRVEKEFPMASKLFKDEKLWPS